MSDQVKLLGMWASAFSCGVEFALKLKGVEYEYIEENLENKSDMLLKYNPVYKTVLVLVHNGKPISGFLLILDCMDETWKNHPLLPSDERANYKFWAKLIDQKMFETGAKALFGEGKRKEEGVEEFHKLVKWLEDELEGKKFFGGDEIGYLDIAALLVPFLFGRAQEIGGTELVPEHKFPIIFKWCQKITATDLFNKCFPLKEMH